MTDEERAKLLEEMSEALKKNCVIDDGFGHGVKAALSIAERAIREDCVRIATDTGGGFREIAAAILASIPKEPQ